MILIRFKEINSRTLSVSYQAILQSRFFVFRVGFTSADVNLASYSIIYYNLFLLLQKLYLPILCLYESVYLRGLPVKVADYLILLFKDGNGVFTRRNLSSGITFRSPV
jgi:hypothetical protein